jgi:hypothetical protein
VVVAMCCQVVGLRSRVEPMVVEFLSVNPLNLGG